MSRAKSCYGFIESPEQALELFPPSISEATALSALFFWKSQSLRLLPGLRGCMVLADPHLPFQICPWPVMQEEQAFPVPQSCRVRSPTESSGCQQERRTEPLLQSLRPPPPSTAALAAARSLPTSSVLLLQVSSLPGWSWELCKYA